jgi:streptomycin 6-kinase
VAVTPTSTIWRVRRDGGTAILKVLGRRATAEAMPVAEFLAWRGGTGCCELLERAPDALLLEDAGDVTVGDRLDDLGDDAATAIIGDVIRAIHAPSPKPMPTELRRLEAWFASLFAVARVDARFRRHAETARWLLARQRSVRPLHGDVHHGNVLHSPRGWIAIDPNGLLGDPAFDTANVLCNPLDRDDLCLDPQRIEPRVRALATAVQREPADVLRWAVAYTWLSAAWFLQDGDDSAVARTLAVGRAVQGVLERYE